MWKSLTMKMPKETENNDFAWFLNMKPLHEVQNHLLPLLLLVLGGHVVLPLRLCEDEVGHKSGDGGDGGSGDGGGDGGSGDGGAVGDDDAQV